MKNSKYWAERFEVLESAMNRYGQDAYRQIEPAFDRALREIDQSVEKWLNRIAVNNQISLADARKLLDAGQLEEFKWTVEDYIKYGQKNAINQQWMKQLENASAKFHISKLEAMRVETQNALEKAFGNYIDEVDDMAKKVLENGYYRSIFEVQKGTGIGWDIASINEEKLKRIISKPWATDGENFSSRIWKNKVEMVSQLHNELTRNCILGKAPDEAIKDMAQYVKKSVKNAKSAAGRLVMTEEAYFSAEAQREAFKELGVGEYEIIATLDSRTSEICQDMDGRVLPMSQYEPGVTAPPFHPWCRTTTAPYFDDLGEFERAARDKNGKTYHVPGNMKYSEWKRSFVEGDKTYLKPTPSGDIIKEENELRAVINEFKSGKSSDRVKLGEAILSDYGLSDIPVKVIPMSSYGYCKLQIKNGIMEIADYNLNLNDTRDIKYQIKTAFHEAYHACANGKATDYAKKNAARWLDIEETFAETSAHYKASTYGINDLAPSYPDKLVSVLPRLKQLPEFSECETLIDFGKVVLEARQSGEGGVWMELSKRAMRKKFSYGDYVKEYFPEIKKDVAGYVDKIIENMPGSAEHKQVMKDDLNKAMENIETFGHTLSSNQSLMLDNAIAIAMNRIGVK